MSDEAKKDRSRNCPNIALAAAIELAKRLYSQAGKSKVKSEVAANSLGYSGLNGAALTTLGALSQYGLIDREKGSIVSISQQAIRLIHPLNKEQEVQALRELALSPKVFSELYADGFHNGTEDLIANHLIQNGFTPERARKVSSVFKANIELANLKVDSIALSDESQREIVKSAMKFGEKLGEKLNLPAPAETVSHPTIASQLGTLVLAKYSVPLGENEATIVFTGKKLSVEDFDSLGDFVDYCKKQFERKLASEKSAAADVVKNAAKQELALAV